MAEKNNHYPRKPKRLRDIFAGIAIGGAIGSILGITLAPKKGEETRKIIKDASHSIYQKGKDYYQDHKEKKCLTPFFKKWFCRKKKESEK
jgi:gas vesicle protein